MAQDESERAASRGAHWAGLAAPGIALLTGFMFLIGWSYNVSLLRSFGLDSNSFEEPLQVTVAKGYLALVLVPLVAVASVAWFSFIARSGKKAASSSSAQPTGKPSVRPGSLTFWAYICLLLIGGAIIGGALGASDAYMRRTAVDRGCSESCFYVLVGETEYRGIIVIQDRNRAAIYTPGGLILAKADDIRRISRRSIPIIPLRASPEPAPNRPPSR